MFFFIISPCFVHLHYESVSAKGWHRLFCNDLQTRGPQPLSRFTCLQPNHLRSQQWISLTKRPRWEVGVRRVSFLSVHNLSYFLLLALRETEGQPDLCTEGEKNPVASLWVKSSWHGNAKDWLYPQTPALGTAQAWVFHLP